MTNHRERDTRVLVVMIKIASSPLHLLFVVDLLHGLDLIRGFPIPSKVAPRNVLFWGNLIKLQKDVGVNLL